MLSLYPFIHRTKFRKLARSALIFHPVTASAKPDFRTMSEFRNRHAKALLGFFVQVVKLNAQASLVKLVHPALYDTKIKANNSKDKAMRYARTQEAEVLPLPRKRQAG